MRLLEKLYEFLDLNEDERFIHPYRIFVKAMVTIIFSTAIVAFLMLIYNLITHGLSDRSFGLIDII